MAWKIVFVDSNQLVSIIFNGAFEEISNFLRMRQLVPDQIISVEKLEIHLER